MDITTTRVVTKVLGTEEDLFLGEGTTTQTRAGVSYPVNKINLLKLVASTAELLLLNSSKFPKAAVVTDTTIEFYKHNGTAYVPLDVILPERIVCGSVTDLVG